MTGHPAWMRFARFALAFLLAPAAPAIVVCLPAIWAGGLDDAFPMFMVTGFVTYGHALVLGVPAALVMMWKGPLTRSSVLGAAFLIGALPLTALAVHMELASGFQSFRSEWLSTVGGVLMCGFLGAIAGFAWWWLARPSAEYGFR